MLAQLVKYLVSKYKFEVQTPSTPKTICCLGLMIKNNYYEVTAIS